MGESLKHFRGSLAQMGISNADAEYLYARYDRLYGAYAWDSTPAGIVVGGKLVTPVSGYAQDLRRDCAPTVVREAPVVEKAPAPKEPEPNDNEESRTARNPLQCTICGKRMPTTAALKGHMKKHG